MEDESLENDNVEQNILYDLTIHAEWPQEPEITVRLIALKYFGQLSVNAYARSEFNLISLGQFHPESP